MKSLLKSTYSKTKLLIVLFVFSCGSLMMAQAERYPFVIHGSGAFRSTGSWYRFGRRLLLVYSATDEFSDGDLSFNPHSSYLIYTPDGKLFKSVENHMSRSDEIPERRELASWVLHRRSPLRKQRIRPCSRGDQAESANGPRLGFDRQRIIQRDSAQLSVRKSSQSFTKDRMNPFDLKAALLAKDAQNPVINPHTHGVVHGSNVWLVNSKLPPSRVYARSGVITFLPAICYFFDNNKEYLTRSYSL